MGSDSRLGRLAERGELVRVRRGAYVRASQWRSLDRDDRYRAQVLAVAGTRTIAPVFSSWSAAALWGLPIVGRWPREVHVVSDRAAGGRSDPGIRRHAVGLPASPVRLPSGVFVTDVARTVVDIAAQGPFISGVVSADHALRQGLVTKDELLATWNELLPFRGSRQARGVIAFANPLSGSVQESVSLVNMARLRFPRPVLQRQFVRPDGRSYFVDFWWERWRRIGETDGRIKYSDPAYLRGRTPEQALWEEKEREDWLRTQSDGFGRWPWAVANSLPALGRRLVELGLPRLPPGHADGFAVFPRW
ncbi:Transcriptional regulator, AbiEi antitoxin, Type IV TA system [Agreia sp. COWG]|nr:Transcriptional regulator, AbiEi antitoxin, Type IV TA system [Agreia sp. COWG]